ncbi:MAG: hypothetical protein ACRD3Q_16785 [Terriglobales bacterium]
MLSKSRTLVYSILASFSVLMVSFALQWLVYDDWLHQTGPVHVIGSAVAATITFIFVRRWFRGARERALEARRRFEIIAQANDRIRNQLQAIECLTYASDDGLADSVREAIDGIDLALRGMIEDSNSGDAAGKQQVRTTTAVSSERRA